MPEGAHRRACPRDRRHAALVACAGLALLASPAQIRAQEEGASTGASAADPQSLASGAAAAGQVSASATTDAAASSPQAQSQASPSTPASPTEARPWTATLSAGASKRDGGTDGSWQALALTRDIGQGYVRGGVMRYHGTLVQTDTALPSDYYVGSLGAGGNFRGWVGDGWASYGMQRYGRISSTSGMRKSDGSRSSAYYAFGGDFGHVVALGHGWYLTPTLAASFASGKLLRTIPSAAQDDVETAEPTWSANGTLRLDHAFGAGRHDVGFTFSRNWTSNGLSILRVRAEQDDDGATTYRVYGDHRPDWWFEVGATASFSLTARLHTDVYLSRSLGVLAGDQTTGGISLRRTF